MTPREIAESANLLIPRTQGVGPWNAWTGALERKITEAIAEERARNIAGAKLTLWTHMSEEGEFEVDGNDLVMALGDDTHPLTMAAKAAAVTYVGLSDAEEKHAELMEQDPDQDPEEE